jgi:DNA-binding XRE family transcriptional regulator
MKPLRLCRQLFFQQTTLAKLLRVYQPIVPTTLGEHIMNRRKILGLLQKDIAPILGVVEECISVWESHPITIRIVYFPRIAKFLGYEWWQFDTSTLGGIIQEYRYRNGLRAKDFAKLVGRSLTQ